MTRSWELVQRLEGLLDFGEVRRRHAQLATCGGAREALRYIDSVQGLEMLDPQVFDHVTAHAGEAGELAPLELLRGMRGRRDLREARKAARAARERRRRRREHAKITQGPRSNRVGH